MIKSLTFKFYLNKSKIGGTRFPIYLRIIVNRKKSEIATSYFLEQKEWDESRQRSKRNKEINDHLSSIENEIYEIAKRLEKEKKPLTANAIKMFLTKKDKIDAHLLEFFDKFIKRMQMAGEIEKESIMRYQDTRNHLARFFKDKKLQDILIEGINYKFISDFDLFLLRTKVMRDCKTMERNTVNKHHTRFKTILLRAMREGYIAKNPYWDFKLKNTPSNRTFLTQEELQKIISHPFGNNESLQRVRDIFIFSVYTGLRFEDAQQLAIDQVTKDSKGNYGLQIRQKKTSEAVSVPLLKPAIEVIKKYDESPERKIFKRILPKITNQKLNTYLKVIAELTGLTKNLTHHVARHTCATTILLSNEVPIEVVSKWLGHNNIKTTQIYAKITNAYLQKMAEKIEDRI